MLGEEPGDPLLEAGGPCSDCRLSWVGPGRKGFLEAGGQVEVGERGQGYWQAWWLELQQWVWGRDWGPPCE